MKTAALLAAHPAFQIYHAALHNFATLHVSHETGLRAAFQTLLQTLSQEAGLTLVPEQVVEGTKVRPDGTLRDIYNLPRGYWEAKDTHDDLETEILKKKRKGYPFTNILFEDTQKAVLFQNQKRVFEADLRDASHAATLLHSFLSWQEPDPASFENAIARFGDVIPDLARGLIDRIEKERQESAAFQTAFGSLFDLCVTTLNPQIQPGVVVEMLAQHLLTERLFRTIFNNSDFVRRNVIAHKVEETIRVMMARSFDRSDFTKTLDKYYYPIESKAREATGWEQQQAFLNNLYERFFQDFSKKAADTQGIVYTPQPIVNFMLESVDSLLKGFDKVDGVDLSLSAKGVAVLDPCVGTGNFMQNLVRRLSPMNLAHKYKHELFCNENMLLPYYIASLNIEHAYHERAEVYEAFPGMCFTDTLMLENTFAPDDTGKLDYFSEENADRVKTEQEAAITVIIGNPPYNVGQKNENDNNKNRVYEQVRKRIKETYVKDSAATLSNKLYDPYVQFFRWAIDRLAGRKGIVAFVTNNGFLTDKAFDGMRKWLAEEFDTIYHLDLGGNVRKHPHLSGTTHNVFKIQLGVGITFLVRHGRNDSRIFYHAQDRDARREKRLEELNTWGDLTKVTWQEIVPNVANHWLNEGIQTEYADLLAMGTRGKVKSSKIFEKHSLGVSTNRNETVYDFNLSKLEKRVHQFIVDYNAEVDRWQSAAIPTGKRNSQAIDAFVDYSRVKWSEHLKGELSRGKRTEYTSSNVRLAFYRPYCRKYLYFDETLNDRRSLQPLIFPTFKSEEENTVLWIKQGNTEIPWVLAVKHLPDLLPNGGSQCFPFYIYNADGANRRENISNDSLTTLRTYYSDATLTKQYLFAYIYAILHHVEYKTQYSEDLKRELPRIPLVGTLDTFRALAAAGSRLLALHTGYETAAEYPLTDEYDPQATLADVFHVEKMRLMDDKTALRVNPYLTLRGIPPQAHEYKLGNRSALDWIIDQYRVRGDSDPNRPEARDYIVKLVKRIVTVSVETVAILAALPPLHLETASIDQTSGGDGKT